MQKICLALFSKRNRPKLYQGSKRFFCKKQVHTGLYKLNLLELSESEW